MIRDTETELLRKIVKHLGEWMNLFSEMLENGEDIERVFVWIEARYDIDVRPHFAPDEETPNAAN